MAIGKQEILMTLRDTGSTNWELYRSPTMYQKYELLTKYNQPKGEEQKDKNLEYMQKINGNGQTDDRRKNELRKWFYETFKKEHTIS
jgi:hypothetical protein